MKKYLVGIALYSLLCASLVIAPHSSAQVTESLEKGVPGAPAVSTTLVISQFYGGGGNSGAVYKNDFVELLNRGSSPVPLGGWSIQYASSSGTNWIVTPLPANATVQPGQYYLIQLDSSGAVGTTLPTPDFVAPNAQGQPFIMNLSGTTGKLAVVNSTTQLPAVACPSGSGIVDLVGYGSANCSETSPTPATTNSSAGIRGGGGCTDTDNNSVDFTVGTPSPRNSSSGLNACGVTTALSGSGIATPNSIAGGEITVFTVNVTPAGGPNPSTGITVTGDLGPIGGSSSQQFFDDGTNGDDTANDRIFAFLTTIPVGTAAGTRTITATIGDAQERTATAAISLTITAPPDCSQPNEHLILGNPSSADCDANSPLNYLMLKTQYDLAYNRDRGIPNWVAWHLDTTWIGSSGRVGSFSPDMTLPAGWYQVQDSDYTGGGFDRGHHCPSGDRTRSAADNQATFLMTNMMPQASNNNQGVWADLENYCRTLVSQGNELYIYAGGAGQGGTGSNGFANTIAGGRVTVPALTWKVILVLPVGDNDLERINKTTRTIAVIMDNSNATIPSPGQGNWRNYRVAVKKVEALTGYNFFTGVRPIVRNLLKYRVDTQ